MTVTDILYNPVFKNARVTTDDDIATGGVSSLKSNKKHIHASPSISTDSDALNVIHPSAVSPVTLITAVGGLCELYSCAQTEV